MAPRTGILIFGVAAVIAVAAFFYWNDPERRIRAVFSTGKQAILSKDLEKTMDLVSLQYRDDLGLNYLAVKRLVENAFGQYDGLDLHYDIIRIQREKGQAWVEAELKAFGRFQGEVVLLTGSPDGEPARVTLARETFSWKVRRVDGIGRGAFF